MIDAYEGNTKTLDPPTVHTQRSEGFSWNGDAVFQRTDFKPVDL